MTKIKDYSGKKFNKLTFVCPLEERNKWGQIIWKLICDCGNEYFTNKAWLVESGTKKSCGCLYGPKDWTGQKFNHLTFIKPYERIKRILFWELLCDCGNTAYYKPSRVASGHNKSCGCIDKPIDYSGQKYNRLTFIKPTTGKSTNGNILWELICECDPNNIIIRPSSKVIDGGIKSCGCLVVENAKDNAQKLRRYEPLISSARTVWRGTYKDGCDFDTFFKLSQMICEYCGREPYRTFNLYPNILSSDIQAEYGNFTYNGLDRIDNTKGHTPDNVVPCCYECNRAKATLTHDQFLKLINMIYNKHFK